MMITTIHWTLLIFAILSTLCGLWTRFAAPVWIDWRLRMITGLLGGEGGLAMALLLLCGGVAAWYLHDSHPYMTAATLGFSACALLLIGRLILQAQRLGGALPAQLEAAFGPAEVDRPAYSIAAIFRRSPKPVTVETMVYSDSLRLDFYRAVGRSPAPCVIAIHGGAWCLGDRKESGAIRRSSHWLARHGYAVASIDYRLAPKSIWPAQREDLLAAIAYSRSHAAELGIDPSRIVLLGRSAGGQIAEATAYANRDPGIRGVISLYAPADMTVSWNSRLKSDSFNAKKIFRQFLGGTPETSRAAYDSASGALLIGTGAPPTLLLHGAMDTIVPERQSKLMDEKLAAAGVPHSLVSLPWATHGYDYFSFASPGAQITIYSIAWFLAAVTR